MRRMAVLVLVLCGVTACSDDEKSTTTTGSIVPPTECVSTEAPDGRLVHVTVDDLKSGFGRLGSRADSDLTPGSVRIEMEADEENEGPVAIQVHLGDAVVATIDGVAAGETCGIDLDVEVGVYTVTDEFGHDVEFEVVAES